MNKKLVQYLVGCMLAALTITAARASDPFSFAVINYPRSADAAEADLRRAISETNAENLAFVVANGLKAASEPCSDAIYRERARLLRSAQHGLIISLAASDWADCNARNDKTTAAIGRLTRLRDLLFTDEFSLGGARIPVVRQSGIMKFRMFSENTRWELGDVMFATINLPRNNNHYLLAAGRNGEFEDRMVANRDWLQRVFRYAGRKQLGAVVLFTDGNPFARASRTVVRRDGFRETRQLLNSLSAGFAGKVLLVHGAGTATAAGEIKWHRNLGVLGVARPWIKIEVEPGKNLSFRVSADRKEIQPGQPSLQSP